WKDELGMIRFRGGLPPDVGVAFVNRLDAETDREWRAAKRARASETRAAHAADAFVRLTAGGSTASTKGTDLVIAVDLRAYLRRTWLRPHLSPAMGPQGPARQRWRDILREHAAPLCASSRGKDRTRPQSRPPGRRSPGARAVTPRRSLSAQC